jgi:hypothetical protein
VPRRPCEQPGEQLCDELRFVCCLPPPRSKKSSQPACPSMPAPLIATQCYAAARPPPDILSPQIVIPGSVAPDGPSSTGSQSTASEDYCRFLTHSFAANHDKWTAGIKALFGCTPPEEHRRATFYMPELPDVCTDMSEVGAMDGLTQELMQRLAAHPQRVGDPADADVIFLPLSETLVRTRQSSTVSCERCADAVASELAGRSQPVFTSVGVPLPAVGSAVREPSGWCTKLWQLPELAKLTVFSYEGFDYGRSESGETCEAVLPGTSDRTKEYRDFQFTAQDWSVSVPYPLSKNVDDDFQKMVEGSSIDDLVAWQAKMLAEERPTLCGFLGGPRNDFRNVLIKGTPATDDSPATGGLPLMSLAKAPGSQCVTLDTLADYRTTKYCIQPAGVTVSRSGLYQAMAVGCVPVVFSHDPQCVWWEAATRSHLPHQPRPGFGAGLWSVSVNLTAAESNPVPRPPPAPALCTCDPTDALSQARIAAGCHRRDSGRHIQRAVPGNASASGRPPSTYHVLPAPAPRRGGCGRPRRCADDTASPPRGGQRFRRAAASARCCASGP